MASAKLSSKNQITIPKRVLDALGLTPGDKLLLEVDGDKIVLRVPKRVSKPTEVLYGSLRKKVDAVQAVRAFRLAGAES